MNEVLEIDVATGQATERPFTDDEAAQREADRVAAEKAAADQIAKDEAAASARRKIAEASGLTPDEMAALGF